MSQRSTKSVTYGSLPERDDEAQSDVNSSYLNTTALLDLNQSFAHPAFKRWSRNTVVLTLLAGVAFLAYLGVEFFLKDVSPDRDNTLYKYANGDLVKNTCDVGLPKNGECCRSRSSSIGRPCHTAGLHGQRDLVFPASRSHYNDLPTRCTARLLTHSLAVSNSPCPPLLVFTSLLPPNSSPHTRSPRNLWLLQPA